jgi:hypothetical protein
MAELKDIVSLFLEHKDENRLTALTSILTMYGIEFSYEKYQDATNVKVVIYSNPLVCYKKNIALCAHYDVIPGSLGLNDNTCALAVLIKFILWAKEHETNGNIIVMFFDREETGMLGSYNFCEIYQTYIEYAFIFDIIGYGEKLYYCGCTSHQHSIETRVRKTLLKNGISELNHVLVSDNMSFDRFYIPNKLIVALPDTDVKLQPKQNCYELSSAATVYETFHNRPKDNQLELINFETVEKVFTFLTNTFSFDGDSSE